jgi:dUTP pyrophosphatase
MRLKIMMDEGAILPTRAHPHDAGLDLYSREDVIIPARGSHVFDTGIHAAIPGGTVGFLKSKSGLNINHCISSEGVIDSGYTGSIRAKLYNMGDEDVHIHKGQKITQLVILWCELPELVVVDSLEATERGDGGFGSTGAFAEGVAK